MQIHTEYVLFSNSRSLQQVGIYPPDEMYQHHVRVSWWGGGFLPSLSLLP